jgi:hypothetical protein
MKPPTRSPLTAIIQRFLPRLRYPYLFLILGGLFLVDLVTPDPVPLVDELLLAVLTFLAATFTTSREPTPPPKDVTPAEDDEQLSEGGLPPWTEADRSPSRDEEI